MNSAPMIFELIQNIPLPALSEYSYSDAKIFSRKLDQLLGLEIEQVEKTILLNDPHTPWAGLEPQALQTPYPEIRMMLSILDLKVGQTIVDLGAAYGRMGLVIAVFHEGVDFIGYEVSKERVQEGNRVYDQFHASHSVSNAKSIQLLQDDISHTRWNLPDADVFFIYDFGDLESIIRVIDRLKKLATRKSIRVVGRGRRTRDHIERHEPWLSQVNSPLHCGNFSVYRS